MTNVITGLSGSRSLALIIKKVETVTKMTSLLSNQDLLPVHASLADYVYFILSQFCYSGC